MSGGIGGGAGGAAGAGSAGGDMHPAMKMPCHAHVAGHSFSIGSFIAITGRKLIGQPLRVIAVSKPALGMLHMVSIPPGMLCAISGRISGHSVAPPKQKSIEAKALGSSEHWASCAKLDGEPSADAAVPFVTFVVVFVADRSISCRGNVLCGPASSGWPDATPATPSETSHSALQ
eukprot:7376385-Prymnesium_polylepis.1